MSALDMLGTGNIKSEYLSIATEVYKQANRNTHQRMQDSMQGRDSLIDDVMTLDVNKHHFIPALALSKDIVQVVDAVIHDVLSEKQRKKLDERELDFLKFKLGTMFIASAYDVLRASDSYLEQ